MTSTSKTRVPKRRNNDREPGTQHEAASNTPISGGGSIDVGTSYQGRAHIGGLRDLHDEFKPLIPFVSKRSIR